MTQPSVFRDFKVPVEVSGFQLIRVAKLQLRAPEWLIGAILEVNSLAMVFGKPGCGKSFLSIDIACCVATGTDWWGHRVKTSPVIYIAGEGHNGLARRLNAWSIHTGQDLKTAPLYVSNAPAALCDPTSAHEVITATDEVVRFHGAMPGLIVLDTLARNFGPGDENSTEHMGHFIAAADTIRTRYGCAVLLVHHTGHVDGSRARGSTALKGALDAEYRLDKDEAGIVRFEATKMKDASYPEPLAFHVRSVELPITDEDEQPVTSAVLEKACFEPAAQGKAVLGKWQKMALEILEELHRERRANLEGSGHDSGGARVSAEEWRVACYKAKIPRQRWAEIRDSLPSLGFVRVEHGFAWPL